jgi:hypothetical protein
MDIFLKVKHLKEYLFSVYALMVFKVFQKFFTTLYSITYYFRKCLLKPFSVIGTYRYWYMFSGTDLSLAAGKMRRNLLVTGGFRYDFTESQAAFCMHFQNHRLRVFEAGYWKDFQN